MLRVDSLEARESTLEGVFMVVVNGDGDACNGERGSSIAFTFTCARIDGEVMSASILSYLIRSIKASAMEHLVLLYRRGAGGLIIVSRNQ